MNRLVIFLLVGGVLVSLWHAQIRFAQPTNPSPPSIATQPVKSPALPKLPFQTNEEMQILYEDSREWRRALVNWTSYPFTMRDFQLAHVSGSETNCGFAAIFQRLERGENITIGVYGGSVSLGRLCVTLENWGNHDCAWPARVQRWFARHKPEWKLRIINFSRGGVGSASWILETKLDVADAYILDVMVNYSPKESTLDLIDMLNGPKLFLGLVESCSTSQQDCAKLCSPLAEELIRIPSPRIPRLQTRESGKWDEDTFTCSRFWDRVEDTKAYLLPKHSVADFRALLWRNRTHISRPNDYSQIWNAKKHADSVGHDFIAHFMTYALLRELDSQTQPCTISALKRPQCAKPNVDYDAAQKPDAYPPPLVSQGWEFMEDVPGKPGWVATEFGSSNNLTFLVNVTLNLRVTFLQTYENIYPVTMHFSGCEQQQRPAIKLNPLDTNGRTSEPITLRFSKSPAPGHYPISCMDYSRPMLVTFRANIGKFKLLRLTAC